MGQGGGNPPSATSMRCSTWRMGSSCAAIARMPCASCAIFWGFSTRRCSSESEILPAASATSWGKVRRWWRRKGRLSAARRLAAGERALARWACAAAAAARHGRSWHAAAAVYGSPDATDTNAVCYGCWDGPHQRIGLHDRGFVRDKRVRHAVKHRHTLFGAEGLQLAAGSPGPEGHFSDRRHGWCGVLLWGAGMGTQRIREPGSGPGGLQRALRRARAPAEAAGQRAQHAVPAGGCGAPLPLTGWHGMLKGRLLKAWRLPCASA
jgi:hypothetical protein